MVTLNCLQAPVSVISRISCGINNQRIMDQGDSSDSMELSLEIEVAEFTLEDTIGILKDLKLDRDKKLEQIYDEHINNKCFTPLQKSSDVLEKQQKLLSSFLNQAAIAPLNDYPIAHTDDMFANMLAGLDEEIENVEQRVEAATLELKRKGEEISRLKEKNVGLEKMKEACLAANEIIASKSYATESEIVKEIFREVKADTHEVVAELFPDGHMRDFLADLCAAYFAEGNDMYVELTPEYADAANFLLEADLIMHHPYDKERVRLVDL